MPVPQAYGGQDHVFHVPWLHVRLPLVRAVANARDGEPVVERGKGTPHIPHGAPSLAVLWLEPPRVCLWRPFGQMFVAGAVPLQLPLSREPSVAYEFVHPARGEEVRPPRPSDIALWDCSHVTVQQSSNESHRRRVGKQDDCFPLQLFGKEGRKVHHAVEVTRRGFFPLRAGVGLWVQQGGVLEVDVGERFESFVWPRENVLNMMAFAEPWLDRNGHTQRFGEGCSRLYGPHVRGAQDHIDGLVLEQFGGLSCLAMPQCRQGGVYDKATGLCNLLLPRWHTEVMPVSVPQQIHGRRGGFPGHSQRTCHSSRVRVQCIKSTNKQHLWVG